MKETFLCSFLCVRCRGKKRTAKKKKSQTQTQLQDVDTSIRISCR